MQKHILFLFRIETIQSMRIFPYDEVYKQLHIRLVFQLRKCRQRYVDEKTYSVAFQIHVGGIDSGEIPF